MCNNFTEIDPSTAAFLIALVVSSVHHLKVRVVRRSTRIVARGYCSGINYRFMSRM